VEDLLRLISLASFFAAVLMMLTAQMTVAQTPKFMDWWYNAA